jgi:hypothetical protein
MNLFKCIFTCIIYKKKDNFAERASCLVHDIEFMFKKENHAQTIL